jgi:hypothetical protein
LETLLRMIFIEDREGIFNTSIDKVWKLVQEHVTDGAKIHPGFKNIATEMEHENTLSVPGRKM